MINFFKRVITPYKSKKTYLPARLGDIKYSCGDNKRILEDNLLETITDLDQGLLEAVDTTKDIALQPII